MVSIGITQGAFQKGKNYYINNNLPFISQHIRNTNLHNLHINYLPNTFNLNNNNSNLTFPFISQHIRNTNLHNLHINNPSYIHSNI
jgi:hypothetical protein